MTQRTLKETCPWLATIYTEFQWENLPPDMKHKVIRYHLNAGQITLNQARELGGLSPVENGDQYRIREANG